MAEFSEENDFPAAHSTDRNAETKLNDANRNGDQQAVQQAIAAGEDLNRISGEEEISPLILAAEQGQTEIVRVLLQTGADVNLPDRHNHTALTHAVAGNRPEIVKLLVAAGAELDRVGTLWPHNTPLMFAVMKGRATIARALLDGGADVDAADEHGNTALMKASQFGKFNAVRGLLRYGADPNKTNRAGQTALFCCLARPKIVQVLLDAGADPNHADREGRTPLMIAANQRRAPCLRLLLEAGADPNPGDHATTNPLWAAVRQQLAPPVCWLLDAGANPNLAWPEYDSLDGHLISGTTPLMYAAATGRIKMVRLLLSAGADPARANDRGQTALQLAIANNHPAIAELLMPQDGTLGDAERLQLGTGQLLHGAKTGDVELVRCGLATGADINVPDPDYQALGFTPLMHACQAGHAVVAAELLASGADATRTETTNIMTGQRYTALHYAAVNGHASCVRVLADAHAELNPRDEDGNTPLMLAAEGGKREVVEILIRCGAAIDIRSAASDNPLAVTGQPDPEPAGVEQVPRADGGTKEIPSEFDRLADEGEGESLPPFSAIEKAAYRGHLEIVQLLLEAGAQDRYGALVAACLGLHEDIVLWLLDAGVKPLNKLNGNHCTPLHTLGRFHAEVRVPGTSRDLNSRRRRDSWLAELAEKQRSIAARLLEAGAGLEARDALGRTPLHAAVHNQTYQTVQAGDDDSYQLHQGHEVNPTSLVQLQLQSGADPNAVDRFGRTPIMLAAVRNSFMGPYFPGVTEALVSAGADLDARDLYGRSPLIMAIRHGQIDVVFHLIQLGADPRLTDLWGRTVLHWAIKSNVERQTVRKLIRAGVDPRQSDRDGLTALDYARDRQATDVIDLFKELGVADNLGPVDEFCRAVEEGRKGEALELLNSVSNLHRTVSHRSAWDAGVVSRDEDLIMALLKRGADIHAPLESIYPGVYQADRSSALHWAASYGFEDVLRLLLDHGANPGHADQRGRTPVTCAALSRHFSVMEELLHAGGTLDPLAEIYAELRKFSAQAQALYFVQAVQSLSQLFGMLPKQMEGLESVHYWSIQAKEEVVQHLQDHASAHRFVAEREVRQAKVDTLIARARQVLASAPLLVLDLCEATGCGDAQFIGLLPTQNPLAAVAAVGTYGNDQELSNADLLQYLLSLQRTDPFEITAARRDTLKIRFLDEVRDPVQLARSLYGICSDVIHQGYGTMDKLVEAIRGTRQVTLWWD